MRARLLALLIAWAACGGGSSQALAATTAATAAATGPWAWLPTACHQALVAQDVPAAAGALAAFVAAGKQRTLATLLARSRATLAQQLGVDILDAAALSAAGLDPSGGVALCWPNPGTRPIFMVQRRDDARWREHVIKAVVGVYTKPELHDEPLAGGTLQQLRLAPTLPPRLTWASAGAVMAIAGPGGDAGVRAIIAAAPHGVYGDDAGLEAARKELGAAALVGVWAQSAPQAKTGLGAWHIGALRADGRGFDVDAIVRDPGAPGAAGSGGGNDANAMQAALALADRLAPDALGVVAGASSERLDLEAAAAALEAQAGHTLGPRAPNVLRQGRRLLAPLTTSLQHLAAPWSLALYLANSDGIAAGAPVQSHVRAALVLRAQTAADKAALTALARRWRAKRQPLTPAPAGALWALRDVHLGRAMGPSLTPQNNRADWSLAVIGDTLVATWGPRFLLPTLTRLEAQAPVATMAAALAKLNIGDGNGLPKATHLAALGHIGALSAQAQAMIVAGASAPLGQGSWGAAAVPQLLMLGPTGDALRELEALHDVAATWSRYGADSARLGLHLRLAAP